MQKPQRTRAAYSQLILEHREDSMQRLSYLLLCLLAILETCSADFVFTFDLNSFSTTGNCLGDDLTAFCETYLQTFCLRGPSSQLSTDANDCPLGASDRANDPNAAITRTIHSSQPWPGAFQMYIPALDEDDPGNDDDLDDIFINLSLGANSGFTAASDYVGQSNRVTVNMRFRVRCDNNFYRSDCTTFCLAMDDDTNGHYICNGDGSIRCITGFENPGNNCKDRVTSCSADPCMNGGSCSPVGLDSHTCACVPGYTGENCGMEIDECLTEPCQNGGNCTDILADYMCECVMGFEDRNCSTNTDECAGVECAGNSTCQDLINGFMCVCNTGFEGDNCTDIVDPCQSSPCAEGSTCIALSPFNHSCSCALGFTGSDCSTNIDECTNSSCPANSRCVDGIAGFRCECTNSSCPANSRCVDGIAGFRCECSCPANSQCVDGMADFRCECDEGFQGDNCTFIMTSQQEGGETPVHVIVGAVVGGVGGLLILLLLVLVAACIIVTRSSRRRKKRSEPDGFTATVEADNIYASVESGAGPRADVKKSSTEDKLKEMTDNPLYGSNPTSPDLTTPNTQYNVPNPVYAPGSTDPIYSEPKKVDIAVDLPPPAGPGYSYAAVNGAGNENSYETAGDVTLNSRGAVAFKNTAFN